MSLYLFEDNDGFKLRFMRYSIDDDFGTLYLFAEEPTSPIWVSSNLEDLEFIIEQDFVHPKYSMLCNCPSKENIDFSKYKIKKYESTEDN